MATIPKHFEEAFPWITQSTSKVKVNAPGTKWIEKEIIRAIFRDTILISPDTSTHNPCQQLIKTLGVLEKDLQVCYIKKVANYLAEAAIDTPLPVAKQAWLNDVNTTVKKLTLLLKQEPKQNLPKNWNNLFTLTAQIIKHINVTDKQELSKVSGALKEANLIWDIKSKAAHGNTDLVAILNLVSKESKGLADTNAMSYYKYPQTFFEEIRKDNTLFLAYQRRAIRAITIVNKEYFGKPYETLTALRHHPCAHIPIQGVVC